MTIALPLPRLGMLRPIDLAARQAAAALETRHDRKYVLPVADAMVLLSSLGGVRELDIDGRRVFEYETTYFDTDDLGLLRAAARSRPRRSKVRTRAYVDSNQCTLEVNTRDGRGRTVKHRMPWRFADRHRLAPAGRAIVESILDTPWPASCLSPALTTRYLRRTLFVATDNSRTTVDCEFRGTAPDGTTAAIEGHVIIEVKAPGGPGSVDRALWRAGHRPVPISKHGVGLAVAAGARPANTWHRTIARYVA